VHPRQHARGARELAQAAAAAAAAVEAALARSRGGRPDGPLRVLDVGSCYNPFAAYPDLSVTALDLCPADPSVWACDFLQCELAPGAPPPAGPPTGRLSVLPEGYFHVVILSLVLSYVPCPLQRAAMVAKARRCLAEPQAGGGLLLLVTPHSSDRYAAAAAPRAQSRMQRWRGPIEALGFQLVRYDRLPVVHLLAFRTLDGTAAAAAAPERLQPLPIAFDEKVRGAEGEAPPGGRGDGRDEGDAA